MKKLIYFIILFPHLAFASFTIDSTRYILNENSKKVEIKVKNTGYTPSIFQVWVDDGNPFNTPDMKQNLPIFVQNVTFKLLPQEISSVNVINKFTEKKLKQEKMFWVNIYEIQGVKVNPSEKSSNINMATRLQVKFFIRPEGLNFDVSNVNKNLNFSQSNNRLIIQNNNPFYVSMGKALLNGNQEIDLKYIPPFTIKEYNINFHINNIKYNIIDDNGNLNEEKKEGF